MSSHYAMSKRQLKPADEPPTFFSTEFDRGVVGGAGDGGLDHLPYAPHLQNPALSMHPLPPPPLHGHHQQHQTIHHQQQHHQPQPPPHQPPTAQAPPQAAPAPNPKKRQRAPKAQAPPAPSPQSGNVPPPANPNNAQQQQQPPPGAPTPAKRSRTNTAWTQAEEQLLKQMRDAGASWSDIAKSFPSRTEGSVKKHWYKDMHWAEFGEEESQQLLAAIKEYDANKWKVIGAKVNKPAKACEAYAKEHFAGKI